MTYTDLKQMRDRCLLLEEAAILAFDWKAAQKYSAIWCRIMKTMYSPKYFFER